MVEKSYQQDTEIVSLRLELKAKLGCLKVSSKIVFFEIGVLGSSYKAPTMLTKVPAGEHELKIRYKEVEFSHRVKVKGNQTVEYLLTREIVQAEKKRIQVENDHLAFELAQKAETEEALRKYIASYELHQAEAKKQLAELELQAKRE